MENNQSIIDVIYAHFSEPFGKGFFETAASILATAIVLFFYARSNPNTAVCQPLFSFTIELLPEEIG